MRVIIHQSRYYDWEPLPPGVVPTAEDRAALRVKPMADGSWRMRVEREQETHTVIGIPDSALEALAASAANPSSDYHGFSRPQLVAVAIQKSMRHHGHVDHWGRIEVEDEPALEPFLNTYFGVKQ